MKTYSKYLALIFCALVYINDGFSQKTIIPMNGLSDRIFSGTDCDFNNTGFSHSVNGNKVTIDFISTNQNNYSWQTQDGIFFNSNTILYATSGVKNLCLNLRDSLDPNTICDTSICHVFSINVDTCPLLNLQFNAISRQIFDSLIGIFNISGFGYTDFEIDYGDGSPVSSSLTHNYDSAGTYNACITFNNSEFPNCNKIICKQLTFTNDTTTYCHINNVQYSAVAYQNIDTLIGNFNFSAEGYTSYSINYGDGSPPSTLLSHKYNAIGSYFTCLTLYNSNFPNCTEQICKQVTFIQDTTTLCDIITCILPGDADHDFTVNNYDALALGLSYNREGVIRPNATTQYTLQACDDWNTTHHYGYNDKFADCNGDGVINATDATVISQNYIVQPRNIFNHGTNPIDSLPAVKLIFDTLPNAIVSGNCVGAQLVADIDVGSASHNIDSIYGIAFSVNYPFDNDSCFSVQVDVEPNSWFQTNNQVLLFYKNVPQYKRIDVTIVRIDGNTRSGFGKVGEIRLITEGDIFGIYRRTGAIQFDFSVTDVVGINNIGKRIGLSGSSSTVNFITTRLQTNKVNGLKVYPNPTNNIIYLHANEKLESIVVLDIFGKVIKEFVTDISEAELDLSTFENGMYIIEIKGKTSVSYEKIFKQ